MKFIIILCHHKNQRWTYQSLRWSILANIMISNVCFHFKYAFTFISFCFALIFAIFQRYFHMFNLLKMSFLRFYWYQKCRTTNICTVCQKYLTSINYDIVVFFINLFNQMYLIYFHNYFNLFYKLSSIPHSYRTIIHFKSRY